LNKTAKSARLCRADHLLADNIIYTTAEIVLGDDTQLIFTREKDGTTSWEELQVSKKQ